MAFNSSPRIVINISRAQSRSRDLPSKIQKKTKNEIKKENKNKTQLLSFDFWAIGEGLNIPRNKVARVM
jgi:lipid II:glycine glycyltransferase (peptidoglycan interpeptide bridge formation enzyme)